MAPEDLLRLRAEDAEDLAVISAVVQDALISVKDLTYDRAQRRFTLVANRFRWEGKPPNVHTGGAGDRLAFERRLCALSFADVNAVSYRGFRRRDDERILSLLAIRLGDGSGTIELEFSGGATVRLGVLAIRVYATDIGEAWPTAWQPDHSADDPP
ncbi:MAG: DUF2948 family protein [Stellaceae bacterium]